MPGRGLIGMATIASALIVLGCVKTAFLATDPIKRYEPTSSIEVYWEAPERPHVVIGQVSAKSGRGQEAVFAKLKDRAMAEGAHAIIMGASSSESSVVGQPMSGGGTLIVPVSIERLGALAIRFTDSP